MLNLVNCSSLIIVQVAMVRSCTRSQAGVSSIIISPTFGWKKVSSKCYLSMSSGIVNFTTNTPTILIGCFKISYVIPISSM
jgi:hypothetical protein